MTKDKVEKVALILLIAAGIAYLYGKMIFWPKWNAVGLESAQLQQRERLYHTLASYAAEPGRLDKKIANLHGRVKAYGREAPRYLDKAQIMVNLHDLAKEYKVNPLNVSFAVAQSTGTAATVGITLACSGPPADVLALAKALEDEKFPWSLNGMNLSAAKGVMQAQLKLTAYALTGGDGASSEAPPPFMNYPFGGGDMAARFQ
ncbi:hypothetical protein CEB3_c45770 [Peptococcaceae bacterium CEB3]|nr:hypothetical protein CEB3_c45770 [Peptococcaceae bacterium CEB3]